MSERKSITKELIEIIQKSQVISRLNITPKDVRIGVFYTGVVLSTGHAGMSYTPVQEIPEAVCCPRSHAKMPQAGNLLNFPLENLMEYALDDNVLKAAVGIATINALSAILLEDDHCPYKPSAFGNALDLIQISKEDTVVMVGAFPPFIKKSRRLLKNFLSSKKIHGPLPKAIVLKLNPKPVCWN